jgi:hypothetical protein
MYSGHYLSVSIGYSEHTHMHPCVRAHVHTHTHTYRYITPIYDSFYFSYFSSSRLIVFPKYINSSTSSVSS